MRVAAILAGVVLGLAGLFVSVIYLFAIGWGCTGSDASEPPQPGSTAAELCDSPAIDGVLLALGLASLVAPVVGGVIAARRRRPAPLLAWIAVAAGAVTGLALMLVAVGSASDEFFVVPSLLVCVCAGAVAFRLSRAGRSPQ